MPGLLRMIGRRHVPRARHFLLLPALIAALLSAPALAEPPMPGHYQLAEGPDIAGELAVFADGRFEYFLAAGALDEWAQGRWERRGEAICLFTEPRPVPPVFARAEDGVTGEEPGEKTGEERPTLLVTWPNGKGIPGIDFRIGFAKGDPIEGYTQYYGWTMPEDDHRTPAWIEVSEPVYRLKSPRFSLTPQDGGKLHLELTPNDLGIVDFQGTCLAAGSNDDVILFRKEGTMRFVKVAESGETDD